ncbi:MAG: DedA family protein [Bacteroidota bacterium]
MADQIVQYVVEWVSAASPLVIYLVFFAIAYLENVVPPVPGDILVAFGGYLAATGIIGLFPLWLLTVVASVLGFMNMYWLGRTWGLQIQNNRDSHFILRFIDYSYFRKGKLWMKKYGQGAILLNRFLAGTRSVISLTAGMTHLPAPRTAVSSFISSALWNGVLIGFGWFVQDNWKMIGGVLSRYGSVILVVIAIAVLGRWIWVKFYKKKKTSTQR